MELAQDCRESNQSFSNDDWHVATIGEIASVTSGGTPSRKNPEFWGGEIPWITTALIDGTEICRADEYITEAGLNGSATKWVEAGTLLMAMYGQGKTRGKVGILGIRATINQACTAICVEQKVTPEFLFHYLRGQYTAIRELSNAGGQENLSGALIRSIPVPCPPEPEQRAIATTLSDVDALLDGLDRLIAKKRDIKQAAMQQLLTGKTRLPGFEGEWEVKRLGEIAHIKTGSRNNQDKVESGIYPFFVRSAHVERINSFSHDCEAILVPGEGQIGSIFHYINGRFDVHQRVYAITQFDENVSGKYVHLFMAQHFGEWAMQNTVKATVDSLRLPTFLTFEMHLPPTAEEQLAIATVLSDIDAELEALEKRRAKTADLKQAMMQELLTGRTRLV